LRGNILKKSAAVAPEEGNHRLKFYVPPAVEKCLELASNARWLPDPPRVLAVFAQLNVAILEHATQNHASTHDLGSSPAWNAGLSERRKPPRQGDPSITSSARASSVGGTSRPIAFATIRLTTRSNLVGCSTGRSAGFVPPKSCRPSRRRAAEVDEGHRAHRGREFLFFVADRPDADYLSPSVLHPALTRQPP